MVVFTMAYVILMTCVYEITNRLTSVHTIMPWKEREETKSKNALMDFKTLFLHYNLKKK